LESDAFYLDSGVVPIKKIKAERLAQVHMTETGNPYGSQERRGKPGSRAGLLRSFRFTIFILYHGSCIEDLIETEDTKAALVLVTYKSRRIVLGCDNSCALGSSALSGAGMLQGEGAAENSVARGS